MNDTRTIFPQDAAPWCRAHEPQQGRYDDAEPDEPFTMPAVPLDDSPVARAIRNHFGGSA